MHISNMLILGSSFFKGHFHSSSIKHQLLLSLTSYKLRFADILPVFSQFCIITFVRILTEYMCSVYDFFEVKPYLIPKLLLSFSCVCIIGFIGLFRQLVLFADIAIIVAIIYQFILLVIATRKLRRLLYKRLFDARNFESQAKYRINYFKRALWSYKYASSLLLISLFLLNLVLAILYIHPIIMMIVYLPREWLDGILHAPTIMSFSDPSLNAYDQVISSFVELTATLGTTLQVFPYIIVSFRLFYLNAFCRFRNIKRQYNYDYIKRLIEKNNLSYKRSHYILT